MLNKLIQKKNIILIILAIILLVLWALTLLFGNGEDKIMVLILSLVLPFIIYGFVRLMFKIVNINASFKVMRFFLWFFLIVGTLGTIIMIVEYITGFPNGLSPTLGACSGLIIAVLDEIKKSIEIEGKQ